MNTTPVQTVRVLVTRPAPQAADWVSKLHAHGVTTARALPLLGIAEAPDAAAVHVAWAAWVAAANDPAQRPQLMFVSPNAARCFFQALGTPPVWPTQARALATGPGTVAALIAAGVPAQAILSPAPDAGQFDSETLWARMAHENWSQQPTWIVRGDGGRDWLAHTLRNAGAEVQFVQAYARTAPHWGAAEQALLHQALAQPERTVWLISSSEALDHLPGLLATHAPAAVPDWAWACAVASHPRIAQRCERFGFGRVRCISPTLEAVLDTLKDAACLQSTGHPSPPSE